MSTNSLGNLWKIYFIVVLFVEPKERGGMIGDPVISRNPLGLLFVIKLQFTLPPTELKIKVSRNK
tara:strand:+ start:2766 stop:2960 length:195 start_codon:yes stop_codon:yes gene_type:complete